MAAPAAFAFKSYTFTNVEINMGLFSDQSPLDLSFSPSGIFDPTTSTYRLRFAFTATQGEGVNVIVRIICEAVFEFKEPVQIADIPDYLYPNSLAIVFPYVRSFVSSVTLQANIESPILIPTLNLTGLQSILKENTQLR